MDLEKKLAPSILIAFAVETLTATWFLKIPGWAPLFSILYFASGIAISGMLLYFPAIHLPSPGRKPWQSPTNQRRLVIMGLIALVLYSWCLYWFDEIPIDINNADMLPIIKVMGERFIAGQHSHIYDPIPAIWHGALPIYLPAMWLPYVPALALGIDMRWIAIAGLLFAFGTFIFLYRPSGDPSQPLAAPPSGDPSQSLSATSQPTLPSARSAQIRGTFFLGVLAFLLFWWVVADNTAGVVSVSEEGVVIGYYVLLVLALLSGKPWLTGIAMSLCMLSRYALVGWIPAYLLYLALERRWRQLSIITLTGMLCFTLLFLVPVGWPTFLRLIHLPADYVAFADRVWNDSPNVFSTAPGLAWFFGRKGVAALHGLLIIFSFTIPVLFTVLAFRRSRSRGYPSANIPLASLKLSLVIFYSFIDVPYLYLFYTSSMVSLIIMALVIPSNRLAAAQA
jgi:hypothetical protein